MSHDLIGGYGLGARILYERMPAGVDPLGPDNLLGFVTGPLTGTPAICSGRFTVVGKSPLTGGWGDANCGGYWGPYLRFAGYDAVFFRGISRKPTYVLIDDGEVTFHDAAPLWGKDSLDTEDDLRADHGKDSAVACIGPAGEAMSLLVGHHHRQGPRRSALRTRRGDGFQEAQGRGRQGQPGGAAPRRPARQEPAQEVSGAADGRGIRVQDTRNDQPHHREHGDRRHADQELNRHLSRAVLRPQSRQDRRERLLRRA